jgi:hypothetical protein
MAINFPTMPRFTPEESGALPDLQQAIMQGLGNYMQLQTQPKQMAQDFLAKQLTNKMKGIEAQYAEPMAKTSYDQALFNLSKERQLLPLEMQAKQAQLDLLPFEKQFKEAQIQAQLAKAAKDSGTSTGNRIPLTTGAKTTAQKNIGYYRKTLDSLDQLLALEDKEIPGMISVESTKPKYLSSLAKVKDQFAKSESFPGTIPGMKASEDVLRKYRTESVSEYRKRISSLKKEIQNGMKVELENLKMGMPLDESQQLQFNNQANPNENIVEYHLVNGRYIPKG